MGGKKAKGISKIKPKPNNVYYIGKFCTIAVEHCPEDTSSSNLEINYKLIIMQNHEGPARTRQEKMRGERGFDLVLLPLQP